MNIDYENMEPNLAGMIRNVEDRPHVRYIRYLFTKMFAPWVIRKELLRLGLSAPTAVDLVTYYNHVVDPLLADNGISKYYRKYKNSINKTHNTRARHYQQDVCNFELTFGKDDASRVGLLKVIKELEIGQLWSNEISRYYGSLHNIPTDEAGERYIAAEITRDAEKVLLHPKRYLLEKLLLENVPVNRIVKYLKENHKVEFVPNDVYSYVRNFFNFKRKSVEEVIERLNADKNELQGELKALGHNEDLSLGDKSILRQQFEAKITMLDESIKELTAMYSETTYKQGVQEHADLAMMFKDIVIRGYDRFLFLDKYKDRDVVDPLTKVAKMMGYALEKMQSIDNPRAGIANSDKGASEVILGLYSKRYDELLAEQKQNAVAAAKDESMEITADMVEGMDD